MTADELLSPGDDRREIAALQHNLSQLQAEIDELKEVLDSRPPVQEESPRIGSRIRRVISGR